MRLATSLISDSWSPSDSDATNARPGSRVLIVLAFADMLPHHITEVELTAIEHKSRGGVVRLVRYTRELRELLVALHPQVTALEPRALHDVFDREIDGITLEKQAASSRN